MSGGFELVYRTGFRANGDRQWYVVGPHGAIEAWHFADRRELGGVEVHSRVPMYDDAPEPTTDDCLILRGPCWSDGSSMVWRDRWQHYAYDGSDMRALLAGRYAADFAGKPIPSTSDDGPFLRELGAI